MKHLFQQIEAALLPTADQYAPEGSDPKAIVHQWIHAIASGNKPFAAKYALRTTNTRYVCFFTIGKTSL